MAYREGDEPFILITIVATLIFFVVVGTLVHFGWWTPEPSPREKRLREIEKRLDNMEGKTKVGERS